MKSKKTILLPTAEKVLIELGENRKLARKRRRLLVAANDLLGRKLQEAGLF